VSGSITFILKGKERMIIIGDFFALYAREEKESQKAKEEEEEEE